jgi:two-component system phosphate regulon response regulator PhoB
MARERILIVEDDEDIMELIAYNLERENYRVIKVESGEAALTKIAKSIPDLILLDLMLPELDGLEVCKQLRADTRTQLVPIIMVTAKGEESDIVAGLELGADDYITKPFRPKELIARVRSVLRRCSRRELEADETIKVHDIEIRPGQREVRVKGKPVQLTYTEFQVLSVLARRPGWVFTRYQIVDAVRGEDYPVTDRSVDVQIVGLRKKLGKAGKYIETVRGVGYRFRERA